MIKKRELIHKEQSKKYNQSMSELEKSFLQQFQGFGISLYKADERLTGWSKLDLGTNTVGQLIVNKTPCN